MTTGLNKMESGLLKANETLTAENQFLKALLQDVGQHLIDVVGDEWMCRCCGARASLEVATEDQKNYPHEKTCALFVQAQGKTT